MTDIHDPRDLKFEGSNQSEHSVEHKIHSTARVNITRIPLTTGSTRTAALSNSLQTQVSIPHIYNEQTNKDLTEQVKTQISQDNVNQFLMDRPRQISNNDYLVRSHHEDDLKWKDEASSALQQNPSQVFGALHQKEQRFDVSSQPSAGIPPQAPDLCINVSHWEAVSKPPSWKSPKPKQKKSPSVSRSRSTPNTGCSSTVAFAHPESLWSVSAEEKTGATTGHNCTCSQDHCTGENSTVRLTDHRTETRTEEIANNGSKEPNEHIRQSMVTSDCSVITIDETDLQNQVVVDNQDIEVKETDFDTTSNQLDTVSLNTNGNARGNEDLKEVPVRLPSTKDASDRSPFGFFHNDKLFLFVPPSPEKEDPGTHQQADKKSKTTTRPLKLQSDQLMGTSHNLVQRIRNKSDDIPVVIVRPKRKKSNERASNNRTSETKSRTPTKLTSQQLHVTSSNGTTTINLKTGAEGSRTRSPAVNRDGSSLHLKECFIDLGTRQTLPATVQLHGDRGQLLNSAGSSQTWSTVPSTPSPGESAGSARTDRDPVIPTKPSFIIAGSDCRKKALPLLSGEKTSLLADMLLFENRGNHEGKEPITVLLQTDNSKTLLTMPKGRDKGKLDTPVTLVRKSPPKCYRDVRSDLPPTGTGNLRHGVHRIKKSRLNSLERKTTDNCVNMHQTNSNIGLKNNASKANSKISGEKKISQSQGQSSHETNTKDKTQNTQRTQSPFGSTHSPRLESLSLPMCLDLQHVSGIDDEPIKETVPVNLFKGIGQLFYAAGAQISTRDGRVTLRRAVFTVCFTSRDRYLRPQTGVPGSLPAFVAFTPDHLVSMIFTSHLCSGFFLLEPTGQVREDPNRPEVYAESALLLPYSHRLPCPTDALFLVIGPLEEDWRSSLKVANSMSKRSVPEDVVRQLIGLEDCRCFSAMSKNAHSETESACMGRRLLSTADFQRHRQRVEALSCSCRDCGAYARSRRGKRKLSDRVSIGSEDDSVHIKGDTISETLASVPNSSEKKFKCKNSQEEVCGHAYTRDQTALDQGALSVLNGSGELSSGRPQSYTHPYTQSGLNSAPHRHEPSQEVNLVHAPASGNNVATSFNLPRNQKCDKMIVKMGFPFKRISK